MSNKTPERDIVTVNKPLYVNVPVKCSIPEPTCDNTIKTDTALISEMRLCINRYKEAWLECNKR